MASKYDIVKLHIDTKGFSSKPSGKGESAIGKVIKRMSRNVYSVTKEKFVEMVGSGHSFIPGLCDNSRLKVWEGVKQKDWMQQDLFFLDFDNEDVKRKIKNSNQYKLVKKIEYITMQDAKAKLESFGIKVMIVYRTFSDGKLVKGKNIEKGRIGVAMSETVTDREKRDKLQAILMGLMATHIDNSCSNRNRYFNGTSQDRIDYVDYTAVNDADEIIERLWKEEYTKYYPKDAKVKKHKNCKNEANKGGEASVEESEPRDCKTYELTPVKEFPDIFPKVHNGLLKYNMQVHLDEFLGLVDETLKEVEFVEGTGRRSVVFNVFNMVSFSYGTREAYSKCLDVNSKFKTPLSIKEFNACTWNAMEHIETNCEFIHETMYTFNYETALEPLSLDDEVKGSLNYFKNKEAKEHANLCRDDKKAMHERIKELYLEGHRKAYIKKTIDKEFSSVAITIDGVKSYIQDHKAEWIEGGAFGTITFYTTFSLHSNNQEMDVLEHQNDEEACFVEEEALEETLQPTLNEQQQYAYDVAMLCRNLALIARGGCGKTYVIRKVINALRAQGKCVGCCAATGLAAQNLDNGKTVHHMFGIISNESIEDYYVNIMVAYNLLDYDAIVIDEVGMLDSETFTKVTKAIKYMKTAYNHHIQLIIAGDPLQLESVEGSYFFESPEYNAMGFEEVLLDKNVRQSNRAYDKLLSNLREGKDIHKTISHLNFIYNHEEDEDAMYVYAHKLRAIQKNNEVLATLPGEEIRLDAYLSVKIGAKVIVTTNARPNRYGMINYYNGMQGTIKEVKANSVIVEKMDGSLVTIKRQHIALDEDSSYEGYPLALGYALTIHKVQGMTLDSLNIHPSCFACGQLYTALSRVKTSSGVHLLAPIKEKDVKVNQRALEFINRGLVRDMAM